MLNEPTRAVSRALQRAWQLQQHGLSLGGRHGVVLARQAVKQHAQYASFVVPQDSLTSHIVFEHHFASALLLICRFLAPSASIVNAAVFGCCV